MARLSSRKRTDQFRIHYMLSVLVEAMAIKLNYKTLHLDVKTALSRDVIVYSYYSIHGTIKLHSIPPKTVIISKISICLLVHPTEISKSMCMMSCDILVYSTSPKFCTTKTGSIEYFSWYTHS